MLCLYEVCLLCLIVKEEQVKLSDLLELLVQMVVSCPVWVLETQLKSLKRGATALT